MGSPWEGWVYPMRYEYDLGIYFGDEDEYQAINCLVSPATPPPPFHHTLLVYCLHTLRALRNTLHSEHGKELVDILYDLEKLRALFVEHPDFQLAQFDGRKSGRRVLVRATLGATEVEHFDLHLKGFPLFGDAATKGCVRSVGVHFHHLFNELSEDKRGRLYSASGYCSDFASSGELGIRNQPELAVKIASSLTS